MKSLYNLLQLINSQRNWTVYLRHYKQKKGVNSLEWSQIALVKRNDGCQNERILN